MHAGVNHQAPDYTANIFHVIITGFVCVKVVPCRLPVITANIFHVIITGFVCVKVVPCRLPVIIKGVTSMHVLQVKFTDEICNNH